MELAIKDGIKVEKGQTLYYINTGTAKSHGDIKTIKDADGNKTIEFGSELLNPELLESDDTFSDKYNVAKYIDAFNKKVEPLLVCFHPNIRDRVEVIKTGKNKGNTKIVNNILINLTTVKVADDNNPKKTQKIQVLEDRKYFTKEECQLSSGNPYEKENQDDYYENLMKMEFAEIEFWMRVKKQPNNMTVEEWVEVQENYVKEKAEIKRNGIKDEKAHIDSVLKTMELEDYNLFLEDQELPLSLITFIDYDVIDDKLVFISRRWGELYGGYEFITKYYEDAKRRHQFYQTLDPSVEDKYGKWKEFEYSIK